jgi:hypothetical protein
VAGSESATALTHRGCESAGPSQTPTLPPYRAAAAGGAQIVVTTECFLDGYAIADKSIPLDEYRSLGEPIPAGPHFRRLAALADELNIHPW